MIEILTSVFGTTVLLVGLVDVVAAWRKRNLFNLGVEATLLPSGRRTIRSVASKRGMGANAKTSAFLIFIVVAMLAWEAFALIVLGPGATISEVYWRARTHFPIDFFIGFLCGHLMWQSRAAFAVKRAA